MRYACTSLLAILVVGAIGCARHAPVLGDVASSPLGQVHQGMSPYAVHALLGDPTDRGERHITGKVFIPFYFGDDAWEEEWYYQGVGRVIFSGGMFFPLAVSEVEVDPNEPGYYER